MSSVCECDFHYNRAYYDSIKHQHCQQLSSTTSHSQTIEQGVRIIPWLADHIHTYRPVVAYSRKT